MYPGSSGSDDVKKWKVSSDNVSFDPLVANTTSALWTLATGAGGVRTVYARFVDAAGNLSTAFNDAITLDTQAPAAPAITSPVDNTSTQSTAQPTLSGTAEAGATVTVNDGATLLGMVTATGGNWSLAGGTTLTEGIHSFSASATDTAGNTSAVSTITYTVDVTAPVITLLGDNPLNLDQNGVFTEPGSTVSDNLATGLTAAVAGSVDTSTVGTYTLMYTASDAAGIAAIAVIRTVEVVDIPAPAVSNSHSHGGCSLNPAARFDPTMLLMLLLSVLYLGRYTRHSLKLETP